MSIKQQALRAFSSYISTDAGLPQLQIFVESISQASLAKCWSTTILFPVIVGSQSRQYIYNTVGAVDGKSVGCALKDYQYGLLSD